MDENETVDPAAEMLNEGTPPTSQTAVDYQKMFEEMQRQNAALAQQNQQLAVTVQQVAARPVMQQPVQNTPDPFAAFAPETAAALKGALEQQAAAFKQQLEQTQQQFANMSLEQEAASIALTPGLTPDQAKRAQDIFRGNRSKGIPINATECIDVVLGADFRAGKINIGNRQPPPVITGGSRGTPQPATRNTANVDRMSFKEQIKYYESMEGFDSVRIEGIVDNED